MNYFDDFIKICGESAKKWDENCEKYFKDKDHAAVHAACIISNMTTKFKALAAVQKQSHIDLLKAMPCQCAELYEEQGGIHREYDRPTEAPKCEKHKQLKELE